MAKENTKRGNPNWTPGQSANPNGRPKTIDRDKKTNREIRSAELLSLTRKLKPHLTRAIRAAIDILESKDASEAGKLRASALVIQTYRELIKDVFDRNYDDESAEEVQPNSAAILSLTVVGTDKE